MYLVLDIVRILWATDLLMVFFCRDVFAQLTSGKDTIFPRAIRLEPFAPLPASILNQLMQEYLHQLDKEKSPAWKDTILITGAIVTDIFRHLQYKQLTTTAYDYVTRSTHRYRYAHYFFPGEALRQTETLLTEKSPGNSINGALLSGQLPLPV